MSVTTLSAWLNRHISLYSAVSTTYSRHIAFLINFHCVWLCRVLTSQRGNYIHFIQLYNKIRVTSCWVMSSKATFFFKAVTFSILEWKTTGIFVFLNKTGKQNARYLESTEPSYSPKAYTCMHAFSVLTTTNTKPFILNCSVSHDLTFCNQSKTFFFLPGFNQPL